MPTKPSKTDLKKLAQFLKLVQSKKPLSQSGYDTLMSCHTLPRYILNHIDTYYRHHQRGGAPRKCCILWSADEREGCESRDIPDPNSSIIGKGAYGQVFEDLKDNTVTKYFTFKQDNSKLFVDHLKARLPLVFEKIKDYGVYQELFTISSPEPEQIAYKMIKLQGLPLKRIFKSDILYNLLLKMIVHKINQLHKKDIVHCDMKVDNVMFLGKIGDDKLEDINVLIKIIGENLKIIDFDGCMFRETIAEEISKGYLYHPTTPAFAHPFLMEHLYHFDKADDLIGHINVFRNICGASFLDLDHDFYHEQIFPGHTYESLFQANIGQEDDPKKLHAIMKFCDYYNMAVSMLYSKLLVNKDFYAEDESKQNLSDNAVIKSTCAVLTTIATKLNIVKSSGGGRKHKHRGGTPPALACPMTAKNKLEKGQYLEIGIGEQMSVRKINVTSEYSSTPEADLDPAALEALEEKYLVGDDFDP